ncbi:MAG: hypothetical protein ACREXT_06155, partial [Gammaproteobacteria bacterium]
MKNRTRTVTAMGAAMALASLSANAAIEWTFGSLGPSSTVSGVTSYSYTSGGISVGVSGWAAKANGGGTANDEFVNETLSSYGVSGLGMGATARGETSPQHALD